MYLVHHTWYKIFTSYFIKMFSRTFFIYTRYCLFDVSKVVSILNFSFKNCCIKTHSSLENS